MFPAELTKGQSGSLFPWSSYTKTSCPAQAPNKAVPKTKKQVISFHLVKEPPKIVITAFCLDQNRQCVIGSLIIFQKHLLLFHRRHDLIDSDIIPVCHTRNLFQNDGHFFFRLDCFAGLRQLTLQAPNFSLIKT